MSRPWYPPGSTVVFPVKNRSGKQRLAVYLSARLGVVEAWAEDLLDSGCVDLDGQPAAADSIINLSAGPHSITVRLPETWPRHMAATPMHLDIIYEDEHIAVLNKPAGRVVHPARGHLDNQTLQNGIRHRYRQRLMHPDTCLGSPHRLDLDTSGILVFALTRDAYRHLVQQFSTGVPKKQYLALVSGRAEFRHRSCHGSIGPDPFHKGRGMVTPTGKAARTDFETLDSGKGWAWLRATPFTGRPHQIRIHAAAAGFPVMGDKEYNPSPEMGGLARQALHAYRLGFRHPADGGWMEVTAPVPRDIKDALETVRSG